MKKRYKKQNQGWQETAAIVLALRQRAEVMVGGRGHFLGAWMAAKKKHGTGAQRADCRICGAGVIVSPRLPFQVAKGDPYHPGMKGEALFEGCATVKEIS